MRRVERFALCPFSYTYTATGKVLTETDVLGHTARWTYDENSRTKTMLLSLSPLSADERSKLLSEVVV